MNGIPRFSTVSYSALAAVLVFSASCPAAPKRPVDPCRPSAEPQAGVPEMATPPRIDGKLGQDEWSGALCITGFSVSNDIYVLPSQLQARVHIGYDSKYLYLGLEQPSLGRPISDKKLPAGEINDYMKYFRSCHWWLKLHTARHGGYDFMISPAGDLRDRNQGATAPWNGGLSWDSKADIQTSIQKDRWFAELRIPFASLGYANGPELNERWKVHLMYGNSGGAQAEWNGVVNYRDWTCGTIIFSGRVPAFQLLDAGRLNKLEFAPKMRVSNPTSKDQEIDLKVSVCSAKDVILDRGMKISLKPGQSREVKFEAEKFRLPKGQNGRLEVEVDTATDHLYSAWIQFNELSFHRLNRLLQFGLTDSDFAEYWLLQCATYPYYDSMDVWADCDYGHLPAAIRSADSCRVTLRDSATGRALREDTIPLSRSKGRIAWKDIDLPDGDYEIVGQLYKDDQPVGRQMVHKFERHVFPWEHNRVGISDKVYPPFTPIKPIDASEGQRPGFAPWGRKYEVGDTALPGRIFATDETPVAGQVISGPFRLEVTAGGRTEAVKGKTNVVSAEPGIVKLNSSATTSGLKFDVTSFLQYDGWYQATIRITPESPTKIDELALHIPFGKYADTHFGYRRSWFYGGFPSHDGALWENMSSRDADDGGNLFTPALAVGNGDVCLWWYANSDQQWKLDYGKPSQIITRDASGVNMRMLLVNHPVELTEPMEVTFAVLANPAKPYPADRRILEWDLDGRRLRWHDTSGYGYWGDGVDSITCGSDAAYAHVRRVIDRWTGRNGPDAPKPAPPVVLYNSGAAIGHDMPEFDSFSGEWCGITPHVPTPEFPDSDLHARVPWMSSNSGLQQDWRGRPGKLVPGWADMVPSGVDCRIWYYKMNMEKLGINGYWFDNAPIGPGTRVATERAYLTADGELRPNYNIFERHDLFRRLFVLYKEAGNEPFNLISYAPDFSFAQWIWMIEMDAYVDRGGTMFDTLKKRRFYDIVSTVIGQEDELLDPIARHRAMTRMRSVPGATASNVGDGDIRASRSVMGLALLHDFGVQPSGVDKKEHEKFRRVLNDMGFGDPEVKYLPYWRNAEYVTLGGAENVVASLFWNPKAAKVLIVIANPNEGKATCRLSLPMAAFSMRRPVFENAETHSELDVQRRDGNVSATVIAEGSGISLILLRDQADQPPGAGGK